MTPAIFHFLTRAFSILPLLETEGFNIAPKLGMQELQIGNSRVFVTPNPSPANAQYSIEDLARWYKELGDARSKLRS